MARLLHHADHARLCRDFRWQYPARLNMADQCLAHAPDRVAIIDHDGAPHPVTFATLAAMTDAWGIEKHLMASIRRALEDAERMSTADLRHSLSIKKDNHAQ